MMFGNMPMNNLNQKVPTVTARLAKLPLVQSACAKLSVLYRDTKCRHPGLRSVCEVLETSVVLLGSAAGDRVSPVILKLEPQISFANDVACKSLDLLEVTFPVLHTPAEQVVAVVRNRFQDVLRLQQFDTQLLVQRVVCVAKAGLDTALNISEALIDHILPPTEAEKEDAVRLVEGFEAAAFRRSYPVRLVTLTVKLCRRAYQLAGTKMPSIEQGMKALSGFSSLPQYLQHQVVSVLFFIFQMYNLSSPSQPPQRNGDRNALKVAKGFPAQADMVKMHPPVTNWHIRVPSKPSVLDNGSVQP